MPHDSPSEQQLLNKANHVKGILVNPEHGLYCMKRFLPVIVFLQVVLWYANLNSNSRGRGNSLFET